MGRNRVALVVAGIAVLGAVVALLALLPRTQAATIAGSHAVFDQPASWRHDDPGLYLEPGWAERQKEQYPADAAFIDATVDGLRSGRIAYSAWIDLDGDRAVRDSTIWATVFPLAQVPGGLVPEAIRSVERQPVAVLPGTAAIDVTLPGGPAVRLDWRFRLETGEGVGREAAVRAYWIVDGGSVVAIQLTSYDTHLDDIASFDAAMTTLRWATPGGS